jgi:hypothetical protein
MVTTLDATARKRAEAALVQTSDDEATSLFKMLRENLH